MHKSQFEWLGLIAAVAASALALMLPAPYVWVTSISGFVLLAALFSYDADGQRSAFQSLAFSAACGLGVMLLSIIYYRWLADKGEVHMTGGRIEYEWLPLTWLGATAAICAIDRIRMMKPKDAAQRSAGTMSRSFIPRYPESEPAAPQAARETVPSPSIAAAPPTVAGPPVVATPTTVVNEPVHQLAPGVSAPAPAPIAASTTPIAAPTAPAGPIPVPMPAGKETEIYVALVGEGLNLMRTVKAEHVGRDFYKIIEPMPEGETWEFTPGQVVRCKKRNLSSGKGLVAVEEAPRAS